MPLKDREKRLEYYRKYNKGRDPAKIKASNDSRKEYFKQYRKDHAEHHKKLQEEFFKRNPNYWKEYKKDGIIKLDTKFARKLGFTSDKFDKSSYLWKYKGYIYISFIMSLQEGKGNVRALFDRIEELKFKIFVPTPLGRMISICEKRGMKLVHKPSEPFEGAVEGYES